MTSETSSVSTPARSSRGRTYMLPIRAVIQETKDAASIVLGVPDALRDVFSYRSGQFVSVRVAIAGETYMRCYSMSSAPSIDSDLTVTVKRVPGGLVSNWLLDNLVEGEKLEVSSPVGAFLRADSDRDIVAFAAGSGITPIYSILKTALKETSRPSRLLYANPDSSSVIFSSPLAALQRAHPNRFDVMHHLDVERGFVTRREVWDVAEGGERADFYICGPTGFMDTVEQALVDLGVRSESLHLERFTSDEEVEVPLSTQGVQSSMEVIFQLGRKTTAVEYRRGSTLLQTARGAGLPAPSSCEIGSCATCMAQVTEGSVSMRQNDALTPQEVSEGWVLTCQAVPTAPVVRVVYD